MMRTSFYPSIFSLPLFRNCENDMSSGDVICDGLQIIVATTSVESVTGHKRKCHSDDGYDDDHMMSHMVLILKSFHDWIPWVDVS